MIQQTIFVFLSSTVIAVLIHITTVARFNSINMIFIGYLGLV